MSIVAVRVDGKGFTMAADSITVQGWTQDKGARTDRTKMFEVNEIVVGTAGLAAEGAQLNIFAHTHTPAAPTEEAILLFFGEFAEWKKKRTDSGDLENQYLIGFEGMVFYCHQWLVQKVTTFNAIGAGMDFALAALHLGHTPRESVEVACELSCFCEPPILEITK
jgi:ATP-dependent protease HslVU (ClpYQ) peptidase subunit